MITAVQENTMYKTKKFSELLIGDTFKRDNAVCIVVPSYIENEATSAICLTTGKIYPVHPDSYVQLVDIHYSIYLLYEK